MKNPISVIIRTSNSEKSLDRLLVALKREAEDEIVIVDTDSNDGTIAIAEKAGATVVRNHAPFNYSTTLNKGFAVAKNDWLLVVSSHCLPMTDDLLDRYRSVLAALPTAPAAIYGLAFFSRRQYERMDKAPIILTDDNHKGYPRSGGNSNALYSRAAWTLHPFDETLKTGEDLEWFTRASSSGLMTVVAPGAGVLYRHPGGPIRRFRKAWDEVLIHDPAPPPMSIIQLVQGFAQATRRLLWDEGAFRTWIGQMAHVLGVFVASQKQSRGNPK